MSTEESDINDEFAGLVRLLRTAYPKHWENHLRNFFRRSIPAELPPSELTQLTEHVFWLVKQTGLRDPVGWLACDRARRQAAIASAAPSQSEAPIELGRDQRDAVDPEPVKRADHPVQSSGEPATVAKEAMNAARQPAEAPMKQTEEPKAAARPVGAKGRKPARAGGRQRKKRRLSAKALKARRKLMLAVLEYLPECPVLSDAARKAGVHRKKLEYWIKRSKAGDDGYDFECEGLIWRFHELVDFAIEEANDKVDEVAWKLAMGELYKNEHGVEVPHLYVRRPNGKMMRFLLERKFPEKYGKHPKVDVPQQGGVVLIGAPKKPKRTVAPASVKARQWKAFSRRVREAKD
jgi:hypothetical protein